MTSTLAAKFHDAMLRIYEEEKPRRPDAASQLREMLASYGGVQTAKKILGATGGTSEFPDLFLARRLDLTVEALVVREPWRQLFTPDELAVAERRIDQVESGGGT